jgi:hypothetical protein
MCRAKLRLEGVLDGGDRGWRAGRQKLTASELWSASKGVSFLRTVWIVCKSSDREGVYVHG